MDTQRPPCQLRLTARPARVAFVIDLDKGTNHDLDEVARFSSGVWGGRQHLLVASRGGDLSDASWALMRVYDPDYVFCVYALNEEVVQRIRWSIDPLEIEAAGRTHLLDGKLRLGQSALDLQSLRGMAPFAAAHFQDVHVPLFIDVHGERTDTDDSRILLRNLGTRSRDYLSDREYADLLHVPIDIAAASAADVLRAMHPSELMKLLPTGSRTPVRAVHRAMLAGYCCPRSNDFDDRRRKRGYEVVVGDALEDQIYAWNRFLFSEGREHDTFWIPVEFVQNGPFIEALGRWIGSTFFASEPRQGECVSYTVEAKTLIALGKELEKSARIPFGAASLSITPPAVPRASSVMNGLFGNRPLLQLPDPVETTLGSPEDGALVAAPAPQFLLPGISRASWMVRMSLADPHLERLPQRPGVANIFTRAGVQARIEAGRMAAFCVKRDSPQSLLVKLPSNDSLLRACLFNMAIEYQWPDRRGYHFRPSQAGLALGGLIELVGGLSNAASLLEPGFWRNQLHLMAGRPLEVLPRRIQDIRAALVEGLATAGVQAVNDEQVDAVVARLVDKLPLRLPGPCGCDMKSIRDAFQRFRGSVKGAGPVAGDELDYLRATITALVDRNVLRRGVAATCPECTTAQWLGIHELRPTVQCRGCDRHFALDVEPKWEFALNELVANAIRMRGLVAVVMALAGLHVWRVHDQVLWLPSQEIVRNRDGTVLAEVDLVALVGGRLFIGEVKSHAAFIRAEEMEQLRDLATLLRPDSVVVAAPRPWPPGALDAVRDLREALLVQGIGIDPMQLDS